MDTMTFDERKKSADGAIVALNILFSKDPQLVKEFMTHHIPCNWELEALLEENPGVTFLKNNHQNQPGLTGYNFIAILFGHDENGNKLIARQEDENGNLTGFCRFKG